MTIVEFVGALEKLSSVLSVERLAAGRRRRIARSLLRLHETLDQVLENGRRILKNTPDRDGAIDGIEVSLLEAQVAALAEVRRLLSAEPLKSVLRIKWKALPKFEKVEGGKGERLTLALATFYGLRSQKVAQAELDADWTRGLSKSERTHWIASRRDQVTRSVPLTEGFRELDDIGDDKLMVFATREHHREAAKEMAELARLTESLRAFVDAQFKPEELI